MTIDEEFDKQCGSYGVEPTLDDFPNGFMVDKNKKIKDWFKSYLREFSQAVKLEKTPINNSLWHEGYNYAVSDMEAKIAEELKKRGFT